MCNPGYQPKSDPKPLPPPRERGYHGGGAIPKEPPPEIPKENNPVESPQDEQARIANRIGMEVFNQRRRLEEYCEVTVTVQAGRPTLTRITTTHKPAFAPPERRLGESVRQHRETQHQAADPAWLDLTMWDRCAEGMPAPESLAKRACVGGLCTGNPLDLAAFVLYFPPVFDKAEKAVVKPYFWVREEAVKELVNRHHWPVWEWAARGYVTVVYTETAMAELITDTIHNLRKMFTIMDTGVDPWAAAAVPKELTSKGMMVTEVPQGMMTMSQPLKELKRLILTRQLTHGGNPVLRAMVSGMSVLADANGNEKPDRKPGTAPINGVIALLNAMSRALAHNNIEKSAP